MQRLVTWLVAMIVMLALAPAVLAEIARLLVPLLALAAAVALVVGAILIAVNIWRSRRSGRSSKGADPWRF